jgi:catechol 2,3-dioxygenase-like lactoylglutathione lyase family enzyme
MTTAFRVIFRASDYEASIAFYRDTLRLQVERDWDRGPTQKGTIFVAGTGFVEVLSMDEAHEPPQGIELYVPVHDVDAFAEILRAQGITLYSEPTDKPWGHRTVSVLDPDGVRVIAYSEIEPSS